MGLFLFVEILLVIVNIYEWLVLGSVGNFNNFYFVLEMFVYFLFLGDFFFRGLKCFILFCGFSLCCFFGFLVLVDFLNLLE